MRVLLAALGVMAGVGVSSAFAPLTCTLGSLRPAAAFTRVGARRVGALRGLGRGRAALRMAEDDLDAPEDDSVMYLPPAPLLKDSEPDGKEGSVVIPLFPLGGYVYLPYTEHTLNIFEPRYRAMYNDILFSGSRRFAVCTVDPKTGSFSQYASVLYLKELKEVSEQTGDAVKFICDHDVIGRVKINKILNPSAWTSRKTYLKAEAEYIEQDSEEDDESTRSLEVELETAYCDFVELQHELKEDVKFTKGSIANFNTTNGEGIWSTVRMWQNFQEQKLVAKQVEMQQQFQERLLKYLMQEQGREKLPEVVNIADLPANLQAEVRQLQMRLADDLAPIQEQHQRDMQMMMQTENHVERLELLRKMIGVEAGLLETKKRLKSLLS
mmetsp:Transcript_26906/g.66304  ORF Transcript_26906/g.66304 Transcript_26906/m.66304 type:complete len:382 (+) Transcript_26906:48-1193(+)